MKALLTTMKAWFKRDQNSYRVRQISPSSALTNILYSTLTGQVPNNDNDMSMQHMPLDLIHIILAYAFQAECTVEPKHPFQDDEVFGWGRRKQLNETVQHDDWAGYGDGDGNANVNEALHLKIIKGWRMSRIIAFDTYIGDDGPYARGLSVVYSHPTDVTQTYATAERYLVTQPLLIRRDHPNRHVYDIAIDEYIDSVTVGYGTEWLDNISYHTPFRVVTGLVLTTNKDRTIQIGTTKKFLDDELYLIAQITPINCRPHQGKIRVLAFSLGFGTWDFSNVRVYYERMYEVTQAMLFD